MVAFTKVVAGKLQVVACNAIGPASGAKDAQTELLKELKIGRAENRNAEAWSAT